jgi:hypothetical protein
MANADWVVSVNVVLVNDVNAIDTKGVRSHAWSVDVELGQICSSRPCRNHGRDRDTGEEALKGVASKINLLDTAVAIASRSLGIGVQYGPRNFSAFFVSFTQTHNIQHSTTHAYGFPSPPHSGVPLPCIPLLLSPPCLAIMSHHNTCPNNKDKHPGMVDLSLQRRTQTQRRVENELSAEDKEAREEARKAGILCLGKAEQRSTEKMKSLMAIGSRPKACMVTSASSAMDSTSKCICEWSMGEDLRIKKRGTEASVDSKEDTPR